MTVEKPTYEMLEARLQHLETVVQECERLSVANRYAAAVMHEVNNPLEAITNLAYLMQHEDLTPAAHDHLKLLQEQLAVLTAVTRPSLAFYRDQKSTKETDVVSLIDSVNRLYADRLQHHGIALHRRSPDRAVCEVVGSELFQVLSNLVLNAAEALSGRGEGSQIHIRVRACEGCIHLLVADDGPGIPDHLEASLFEAHATGRREGSGLGLWISRRIIQKHRGIIRCRTSRRAGRTGTCFRIFLPCKAAA